MKRLVSMILVCCMILSTLPISYAESTVTGNVIVYDFEDKFPVTDPATAYSSLTYGVNNNLWEYKANSKGYTNILSSSAGIRAHKSIGEIALLAQNPEKTDNADKMYWIAFEIDVPKKSTYDISVNATPMAYGKTTYVNVYLFGTDTVTAPEEGLVDANKLTSKKFKSDTENETLSLGKKELEAGKYYFVFTPATARKNSSGNLNGSFVYLNKFILEGEIELESASVSLEKNELYPGEFSSAIASAKNNIGENVLLEETDVEFESSNEAVAIISSTGKIYAVSPGTTEITVTVSTDKNSKTSAPQVLTVKSDVQTESVPEELFFSFPQGFLQKGESTALRVTDANGEHIGDGIKYTYTVEDESVVTEKNGIFSAKKIGRTKVNVLAELGEEKREFSFDAVVVGENLLVRHGVDHGQFENSIYMRDNSVPGVSSKNTLWFVTKNEVRDNFEYTLLENRISPEKTSFTNFAKISFKDTITSTSENNLARIQGKAEYYAPDSAGHAGLINLDSNKLYEYTGYIKCENIENTVRSAKGELFYYTLNGTKATSLKNYNTYPWEGMSGDQNWTRFNVPAVWLNWKGYDGITVDPRVEFTAMDDENADFYIANLHLHEVSFETVDFRLKAPIENPKTYDTFETTFRALTNTGNEIISGDENQKITAKYSSTNETVARVSENGVITVVSDGECEIIAEVTINGVTQKGRIPITLSGLEVMFEKVEVSGPDTMKVGESVKTELKFINTDSSEYTGNDITVYMESDTPELATIDQNGEIIAKNPGVASFSVYANASDYNVKTSFEIKISDETPLASAEIKGAKTVEKGFSTQLEATAFHESGKVADISACEVKFSLCDGEDASVLEITEDGTITGLAEGCTKVQVSVTLDGVTVISEPYQIEVGGENPKNKSWDFRDRPNNSSALDATLETDGWRINREETAPSRVTAALGGNFSRIRCLTSAIQFNAATADNTIESDLAIDFVVDHSGWYQPIFVGRRVASGKDASIYIEGEYSGYCNFKSGGDNTDIPAVIKLNPIYLEKGIRTLTLRAETAGYLYPISFAINLLSEEPALVDMKLVPEKNTVAVGESVSFDVLAELSDGMTYKFGNDHSGDVNPIRNFTASVSGEGAATVSGNRITATKAGTVTLSAKVNYNGNEYFAEAELDISPEGFSGVALSADTLVMKPYSEGESISILAFNHVGNAIELGADDAVVFSSSDESVVTVDEYGYMTPMDEGTATISADVTVDGITHTGYLNVSVRNGKTKSTYFTEERVLNARENTSKYDWAKDTKKSAQNSADYYLEYVDFLYEMIPSQGIPRSYHVGYGADPDIRICRYCGENLQKNGSYPWTVNAIRNPWKVQCSECKRFFPSNDFAKLYELGKNEHGEYDVNLAHERNEKLRTETNGEVDYLKNTLYPELYNPESPLYNKDPRTGDEVDGTKWGVDDGFGYVTGRTYPNGTPEVHTYIAAANHLSLWRHPTEKLGKGVIYDAIVNFRDAYVYTGDKRYGRAGAILLDRLADFYPDYSIDAFYDPNLSYDKYHNSGGNTGKILGAIWDAGTFTGEFATAYDAFFDMYDDSEVISFLSEKAEKYSYDEKFVENAKGELAITSESLRGNIEKNLLEEVFSAVKKGQINGNFGMKQNALSEVAVVYDTEPMTTDMLSFVMQSGDVKNGVCSGGNVFAQLMNTVDRDGYGNEASFGYNVGWPSGLLRMMKTLSVYENIPEEYNLASNPKYIKMLPMQTGGIVAGIRRINLGDNGSPGGIGISFDADLFIAALDSVDEWNASEKFKEEKRVLYSQILYLNNGNKIDGLHYDIFTKDPESLQSDIESVIKEYGEYELVKSDIRTGFGLATLQDGLDFRGKTLSTNLDITTRSLWMYFGGGNTSHKHYDGLNLGIDAFGMNMSPDLGYPSDTGAQGGKIRDHWVSGTVSHNTVVVNDKRQAKPISSGDVIHFDDSGEVKVMDVNMPSVYGQYVDTYRRSVVSVDIDDTVSYTLDFFRIIGGDEHVYSFHAQGRNAETPDLDMIAQPIGTYAGANIPYGDADYSASLDSGYNYLENVERAKAPGKGTFTVDFEIEKMRKFEFFERDWHLKLTMLNDFELSEVAIADGKAPERGENPPIYKYLLARRSGKNMDTLFTTVFEPYIGESNIKSLERVSVKRTDGKAVKDTESVAAIKVTLKNGRVDYVIYSSDNKTTYRIDDLFDFCGFIGVYTVSEEDREVNLRSYLLDGTKIGNSSSQIAAIEGKVKDFTKEPSFENFIEIELEGDTSMIDADSLSGKLLDIENDGYQNGDYWIKNASLEGNILRLNTDDVTTIRGFADAFDFSKGYSYNINENQKARIALSSFNTSAPKIEQIENVSVSAGSSLAVPIKAESSEGRKMELIGTTLPRGMSIDQEKMMLIWKPSSAQVGENHVAITASDGTLTTTIRFTVTVYGSTSSGGGGNGGHSDNSSKPSEPVVPEKPSTETPEETARFTDLGAHAWAESSINALADEGIIKGTSENTFSPAANITRADFAILLVRAFKLESDNTENFSDVSDTDYFAKELAIARNEGIVGGIGDNKYAPKNNITRQDMMVIVYRALTKLGVKLESADVDYADFTEVADYAEDAVKSLITSGLVNGKNGKIAPTDYTTRAEVAVLLKRILNYIR